MSDTVKFSIGQMVYFKANAEKCGMVVGILYRESGVTIAVTWDDLTERWHSQFELSSEKVFAGPIE